MNMRRYIVLLKQVKRGTNEIEYCNATIRGICGTEEEARQYYDKIDIAEEYYAVRRKKNIYLEASLKNVEFIYDEKDKVWHGKDEDTDLLETKTAGKYFGNDDKMLYLVETNGIREFWTVENRRGVITLRYVCFTNAKNCNDVYSDRNWYEKRLSDEEFDSLFTDVKIIDSKNLK